MTGLDLYGHLLKRQRESLNDGSIEIVPGLS
jgi:hypothetical protein